MKKFLLLCFIFSSFYSFAQDWQPFPLGQKSFFESNEITYNGFDTGIVVLHYDTLFDRGNFQTMYFSYNDENYANCYNSVYFNPSQGPFSSTSYYLNRVRPDTITINNDSIFFYFNNSSVLFLPKSEVGESWYSTINVGTTINKLQFTCDSVYFDTVVGNISDSLKIFSIKAFDNASPVVSVFDNQKIILSKNYGYKEMVVFSGEFQSPLILNGLKNNSTQESFYYPDFTAYFHLNVGDIIIWKEDFVGDILNPSYTKYYKDSITTSFLSNDSIYYTIQRQPNNGSISVYNQKYLRKNFEWLNKPTSIFIDASIFTFSGYMDLWDSYPMFRESNIVYREVEYFGNSLDSSTCFIGSITDVNNAYGYSTKLGLSHSRDYGFFMTTWDVIGSTINGIQEGVAWSILVTGINTIENISDVKIYPNPNKGIFTIEVENLKTIEIVSIEGKILFNKKINQYKTNLETSLPKGMYLVKLTFNNSQQITQKLVVTD